MPLAGQAQCQSEIPRRYGRRCLEDARHLDQSLSLKASSPSARRSSFSSRLRKLRRVRQWPCSARERPPQTGATSLSLLLEAARASKNQRTADARAAFLALTHEQALTLLNQIEVLDNHPNLIDVMADIEGEIVLIAPSHAAKAASYLEGWWLGVVGKCLVADPSASIPVQHIIMKANEIGRSFGEDTLPVDDPGILGAKGYSDDDEAEMFVRQMRAVDILDRVVRRSAQDYYRAFAQRSKWAREHLLLDSELSRYDATLKDRWHRKFDAELTTTAPSTELEKKVVGRSLCVWASQQSIPLRNIVEVWICSGSFQGLADRLQIGWHPDFETIFDKEFADDAP